MRVDRRVRNVGTLGLASICRIPTLRGAHLRGEGPHETSHGRDGGGKQGPGDHDLLEEKGIREGKLRFRMAREAFEASEMMTHGNYNENAETKRNDNVDLLLQGHIERPRHHNREQTYQHLGRSVKGGNYLPTEELDLSAENLQHV